MIKFFRQSYAIQYVVIALMAFALWIPAFVSGRMTTGLTSPVTPIYGLIDHLLSYSTILQHGVAFLFLALEAIVFNVILVENQIVGKVSLMGVFVYVLLMSFTETQTNFYPFLLSAFFILLVIRNMFGAFQLPKPELNLVRVGAFLALSSMCYFPSIVLIVWVMIVLPMAKNGSLRLQLIPLFGFLFVYFVYFVGVFLVGEFKVLMQSYLEYFTSFHFSVEGFNLKNIILLSVLFASTFFLMFGGNTASFEKSVSVRSKISMVYVMALFALLLLFVGGNILMNGLVFMVLAILVSYAFSNINNTSWANLFLFFFLVLVFANHYYFKFI